MPDREKVIKGLERCKLMNKINCDKCPYDYNGRGNGKSECTAELAEDVLELLKEQEEEIENLKQTAQSMMEGIVVSVPMENPCSSCQEFNCDYCGYKEFKTHLGTIL